eukprot:883263-Pelagomonas_calceolata.AAC.2
MPSDIRLPACCCSFSPWRSVQWAWMLNSFSCFSAACLSASRSSYLCTVGWLLSQLALNANLRAVSERQIRVKTDVQEYYPTHSTYSLIFSSLLPAIPA